MRVLLAALLVSCCGPLFAAGPADLKPLAGTAYYFPKPDICTVMVDYQPSAQQVTQAKGDGRTTLLASGLLSEYAARGSEKCKGATTVRMLAVLVPGKDSYGRPDFGSRTNLIKLEGRADKLKALPLGKDPLTLARIRAAGSLETY